MDKSNKSSPCSAYLRRPLRSLDQALKDHADIVRQADERRRKQLDRLVHRAGRQDKLAS